MHHAVRRSRLLAAALAAAVVTLAAGCSTLAEDASADRATSVVKGPVEGPAGAEQAPDPARYVALGDSFTAAPFVPGSVEAKGCYRSTANYPSVIARALPETEVVDVSCSGADTTHLSRRQSTATGRSVPPQLDALTPETDLVTLGIGGNDFDVFGTMITRCPQVAARDPQGAPCRIELRGRGGDPLVASIAKTQERVVEAVEEVRERSPRARVLLVGYPRLVDPERTCEAMPIARGDYRYSASIGKRLDRALRAAADQTDAELVDVWRVSQGHEICSDDPWVNGKDTDFAKALSYHPFAAGQRAVAGLVLEALGH